MIALIDIDSLFYKACYKLDDPDFVEKQGLSNEDAETIIGALAAIGGDRLDQMLLDILSDIEIDENNIQITSQEIFVTSCKNSIRKQINSDYKANREPNEIVNCLRATYLFTSQAIGHDTLEADDLIADRAREIESEGKQYIVVTMDKDLQQIGGFLYNYYKKPSLKDEQGNVIEEYSRKGLFYYSKIDGMKFLAKQMIMGDSTDCIKGIPKKGIKYAENVIDPINTKFGLIRQVIHEYKQHFNDDYFKYLQQNFRLLYLGEY